jgi:Tfp pilus assembly protein PilF
MHDQVLKEFEYFRDKQVSPRIRLLKARALIACGEFESGMHDLLELKKDIHVLDISINEVTALELSALSGSGNLENVDEIYRQANKKKSGHTRVRVEYGKILVDLGRHEEAVSILNSVMPEYDHDPVVLYNLGLACHSLDDFLIGRDYLLKAQALSPGSPLIMFALASTLYYTKEYPEALKLARICYDELPRDGKTDNLLGNIFLGLNMITEAQKSYYQALELDPDNEEFALNLAESFYQLKDYENALMITRQLVKDDAMDRAKSLHLRLKSHLYENLKCSGCGEEWDFPKAREDATLEMSRLDELPSNAPAGFCKSCRKVYCRNCAPGTPGTDALCPDCKTTLTYDMPGVRIIADRIIRGEGD